MAELPHHRGGGLSLRTSQRDRVACIALGDDLDPSVTRETLECLGRHDRTVLGLRVALSRQGLEGRMNHHGGTIGVGFGGICIAAGTPDQVRADPAVIRAGRPPAVGRVNSPVTTPAVVIRPILLPASSVNHRLPSGPAVIAVE